jgi:hypothetical protein
MSDPAFPTPPRLDYLAALQPSVSAAERAAVYADLIARQGAGDERANHELDFFEMNLRAIGALAEVRRLMIEKTAPAPVSLTREQHAGLMALLEERAEDKDAPAADTLRADKIRQALVCLLIVGPNVSEIARRVGVPRTTLLSWPDFRSALNQVKGQAEAARQSRRGRRAGGRDFQAGTD